jgi:DNA-binding transcriptional ArsR family regulator
VLEDAFDMPRQDAPRFLERQLLERLHDHTLLVLVENVDALFGGLGDAGQKQWRAFLQEYPVTCIVATSQQLFAGVSRRQSPFFGFFDTEHLRPLTVPEAVALLVKIARYSGNQPLVDYLQTPEGRSRVRALHHLAGGNHRVYVVLAEVIDRDSLAELIGPFEKMVDELTPYYQERLRWLAPQQRRIVELLCTQTAPLPVKEVARRLFATEQTIASQLKKLRELGYVASQARGRESLYELTEPLMRLSFEVKENRREPLRLIVDFLRIWYRPGQLRAKLATVGRSQDRLGAHLAAEEALDSCEKAIALNPSDAYAAFNRVQALFGLQRWDEAFAGLQTTLAEHWPNLSSYSADLPSILETIQQRSVDSQQRQERVERLMRVCGETGAWSYLGDGLVRSLAKWRGLAPRREALDAWRQLWLEAGRGVPGLEVPLRIFDVGTRYLMTDDERVLFDLLAPERTILRQALGLGDMEGNSSSQD